jgi:lysophospholipase L1-like esterase
VVFLDGFNDVTVQGDSFSADPTHIGVPDLDAMLEEFQADHARYPGFLDGVRSLAEAYGRTSALAKTYDHLFGPPPGGGPAPAHAVHAEEAAQLDAALDIYRRAADQIQLLAEAHDVPVIRFWQPRRDPWPADVLDRLPPGTVDLTQVPGLSSAMFFDAVHTNEAGAHQVAAAMWDQLQGRLSP